MSAKTKKVLKAKSETKAAKSKASKSKKPAGTKDAKTTDYVFLARTRDDNLAKFFYGLMAESGRSMQDILILMIQFAAKNEDFVVLPKPPKGLLKEQKKFEAHKARIAEKVAQKFGE